MEWFKVLATAPEHDKLEDLAARLSGVEMLPSQFHQTIGHLFCFWCAVALHRETGMLRGVSPEKAARWAGWRGDPRPFWEALEASGLIDAREDGVYVVHDWDAIQGPLLRARDDNRARQRRARERAAHPLLPVLDPSPQSNARGERQRNGYGARDGNGAGNEHEASDVTPPLASELAKDKGKDNPL